MAEWYRGSKYIENLKKISQIKKKAHKNHDLELKHNKEEPKLAGKKNEEPQLDFF